MREPADLLDAVTWRQVTWQRTGRGISYRLWVGQADHSGHFEIITDDFLPLVRAGLAALEGGLSLHRGQVTLTHMGTAARDAADALRWRSRSRSRS